jgi:hypothetical protein
MVLQASGTISMSDINVELGSSSTTTRTFNDTPVRTLADPLDITPVQGAISMNMFYGHRRNLGTEYASAYSNGVYFDANNGGNGPNCMPGWLYGPTGVNTRMTNIFPCSTRYVGDHGDKWNSNLLFVHPETTLTEAQLNAVSISLADCIRATNIVMTEWQMVCNDYDGLRLGVWTYGTGQTLNSCAFTDLAWFIDPYADAHWHYSNAQGFGGYDSYGNPYDNFPYGYDSPLEPYTFNLPNPGVNQVVFLGINEINPASWYRTINTSYTGYN